jgi:hypothetical protein
VADAIRRRARGPRVVILHPTAYPQTLWYLLGHNPRYVFVRGSSPLARDAQFGITDERPEPFADRQALALLRGHMALVRRFPRPHGGIAVKLYERKRRLE